MCFFQILFNIFLSFLTSTFYSYSPIRFTLFYWARNIILAPPSIVCYVRCDVEKSERNKSNYNKIKYSLKKSLIVKSTLGQWCIQVINKQKTQKNAGENNKYVCMFFDSSWKNSIFLHCLPQLFSFVPIICFKLYQFLFFLFLPTSMGWNYSP